MVPISQLVLQCLIKKKKLSNLNPLHREVNLYIVKCDVLKGSKELMEETVEEKLQLS